VAVPLLGKMENLRVLSCQKSLGEDQNLFNTGGFPNIGGPFEREISIVGIKAGGIFFPGGEKAILRDPSVRIFGNGSLGEKI